MNAVELDALLFAPSENLGQLRSLLDALKRNTSHTVLFAALFHARGEAALHGKPIDSAQSDMRHYVGPTLPLRAVAEWVRLGALDALLRRTGGDKHPAGPMQTCPHVISSYMWGVCSLAWKPDLLACERYDCIDTLDYADEQGWTCDGCGQSEADNLQHLVTVFAGPLAYRVRMCDDCHLHCVDWGCVVWEESGCIRRTPTAIDTARRPSPFDRRANQ